MEAGRISTEIIGNAEEALGLAGNKNTQKEIVKIEIGKLKESPRLGLIAAKCESDPIGAYQELLELFPLLKRIHLDAVEDDMITTDYVRNICRQLAQVRNYLNKRSKIIETSGNQIAA